MHGRMQTDKNRKKANYLFLAPCDKNTHIGNVLSNYKKILDEEK